MDSLTKNKKTTAEIIKLCNQSLRLEADVTSISELTNGSFNAVYKVTLANGRRYVLKIAPHETARILRNEKKIMQAEAEALHLIKKHTAALVPEVLYYSDALACCDSPFMIMEWMCGEDYQYASSGYSDETKQKVLFELGTMTYAFHQIHGEAFGQLGKDGLQFSTWSEAFSTFFQNILADGMDANVTLPFDYDYLFQLEQRVRPFLNDVTVPCLIHGDLWLGNVLVHNEKISALLDFERALWGDPLMEYPFGLLRNNMDFLNGYEHLILDGADFSFCVRRALYNLYHYLIMQIEKTYRGFKDGNSDYFVNQKIIASANSIEKLFSS